MHLNIVVFLIHALIAILVKNLNGLYQSVLFKLEILDSKAYIHDIEL